EGDKTDAGNVVGPSFCQTLVQVLKQCGDNLTRENIMKEAANLHDFTVPMLLPGIKINTSSTDFAPINQIQIERSEAAPWVRQRGGIALLSEGKGRKLFISGVNHQVDLDDLLGVSGHAPEWALCCIVLGHQADDTFGNAQETAQWIQSQGFHSLRLVTAWYHMPRSLLEFDRAMPEIDIVAHPVFPDQVKQEHWWARRGTAARLVGEHVKYLGALFRPLIELRKRNHYCPPEPARAEVPE